MASSDSIHAGLAELREKFVRGSSKRLEALDTLLDQLLRTPADRPQLDELHRRAHGLAGIAATFGFPKVTALARAVEAEAERILGQNATPSPDDFERWRDHVRQMRRQLREPASETVDGHDPARTETPSRMIHVVEDDPDAATHFRDLLIRQGYDVEVFTNVRNAREGLDRAVPDGMVIDVLLPDGRGFELIEHLRTLPDGERTVALVVSRAAALLDKVEAVRCGADGFFEKPIDEEALLRRLDALLSAGSEDAPRILYMEDDSDQAEFVRSVLESAGYEVTICTDPLEFQSVLTRVDPDLVLMDIVLPDVSGWDLARVIRQDDRYVTLPLVFLTTETQMQNVVESVRAGGDDFIEKPVSPTLLISTVAAKIERARILNRLVERDGLTGLLTHSAFMEKARAAHAAAQRYPEVGYVAVILDLDHFKNVNDRYGHPVGDKVIASLAALLRRRLRQSDSTGRYGGEEFALVLDHLSLDDARRLMERILEEFRAIVHTAGGISFHVTFSAGVAAAVDSESTADWIAAADRALYRAKENGRNTVMIAEA